MATMPITRVVLYKHGVGYFEREGKVHGEESVALAFRKEEVSDVLKSLIVLDLDGGHVSSVSYDSTRPLHELLADVALEISDEDGVAGLLPQLTGATVALGTAGGGVAEGMVLGLDTIRTTTPEGLVETPVLSILNDGRIRSFELPEVSSIEIRDEAVRRDLEYYLRTRLSAKKKDARGFSIFAKGEGERRLRLAYTVAAPVWKATYRLILGEEDRAPMIQGWAVVDNTQDEDWDDVRLSLISGLPVSFVHDLYTPRSIRRPVVEVKETTGVLPPEVEAGMDMDMLTLSSLDEVEPAAIAERSAYRRMASSVKAAAPAPPPPSAVSSTPTQVRERKLGDLFEYEIEHPVTIKRNQAALVPIVLREFKGRPVLLYNKRTRAENPMRCVELENTTGLTLEGGPLTVLEGGSYVGEAMLDTLKPDETRLVPFAVELGVKVLDNVDSHDEQTARVVIRRGTLESRRGQIRSTTYAFDNKGDAPAVVYLDHPREADDWTLDEPPTAHEITESYWRFRFDLAPKGITTFTVRTQRLIRQRIVLADTSAWQLEFWAEQKELDAPTVRVLREALALINRASAAQEQARRLAEENKALHKEQERLRENLKALGDRASEKELRERFVKTFGAQEDRLEAIAAELKRLEAEAAKLRKQASDSLGALSFEADLGGDSPPPGPGGGRPSPRPKAKLK
ncbi:hypothetical protein [Aquisphaera insulae]|uniref:hypothetical protein n=1 Tax=Aquisphaera insulae TaxID=2712864 RepID=UPI0013EA197A|nr:hypothetical protein [Aquisphaera insulae]